VPVKRLHEFVTELVGGGVDTKRTLETDDQGVHRFTNYPAQGLHAWVTSRWSEAPLETESGPPSHVQVSVDTSYGIAGHRDLHAWIIKRVTEWCDDLRVEVAWENEFTGEWYTGLADILVLGDPVRGRPS
jgi:hypothetical protein